MRELVKDKLKVRIYETRPLMGAAAADVISRQISALLESRKYINIVFAAAPSQSEFLAELKEKKVDWSRINAFHMDEYVGLDRNAPQGFANFLKEKIFGTVACREVFYMNGNAADMDAECERYAELMRRYPTDIIFLDYLIFGGRLAACRFLSVRPASFGGRPESAIGAGRNRSVGRRRTSARSAGSQPRAQERRRRRPRTRAASVG